MKVIRFVAFVHVITIACEGLINFLYIYENHG